MVNIVPFKKDDLPQAVDCLSKTFSEEIMSKTLGIDASNYASYAHFYCERAINNLSLVAKNKENKIVGFTLLEDFAESDNYPKNGCDSRFIIMNNFFEKLHKWYANYSVNYGEILYLCMIGVDEKYQNKGIANQFMKQVFQIAINNNYEKIIAECTGTISQYICEKYGFETLKELNYKSYSYNGEQIFGNIESPQGCKLMLKTFDI